MSPLTATIDYLRQARVHFSRGQLSLHRSMDGEEAGPGQLTNLRNLTIWLRLELPFNSATTTDTMDGLSSP